jgi:hypothetical protein
MREEFKLSALLGGDTLDYHFDIEHASRYGVDEAIMLANFIFWLTHNKANDQNQRDGKTWTYNSVRAFGVLFPFWTGRQIDRILRSLIDQGVIIRGEYNQTSYDKTSWYALADESMIQLPTPKGDTAISPNGEMDLTKRGNGSHQTVKPIPDLKPDTKPGGEESPPTLVASLAEEGKKRGVVFDWSDPKWVAKIERLSKEVVREYEVVLAFQAFLDDTARGGVTAFWFPERFEKYRAKTITKASTGSVVPRLEPPRPPGLSLEAQAAGGNPFARQYLEHAKHPLPATA